MLYAYGRITADDFTESAADFAATQVEQLECLVERLKRQRCDMENSEYSRDQSTSSAADYAVLDFATVSMPTLEEAALSFELS